MCNIVKRLSQVSALSLCVLFGLLRLSNVCVCVYFMNYIRIYCTSTWFLFILSLLSMQSVTRTAGVHERRGETKDNVYTLEMCKKELLAMCGVAFARGGLCCCYFVSLPLLTPKIKWYMMHGSLFDGHYFFYSHWTHLINHKIVTNRTWFASWKANSHVRSFVRSYVCIHAIGCGESVHWGLLVEWSQVANNRI